MCEAVFPPEKEWGGGGGEDGMLCTVHHVYCSMRQYSGYVMVVSSNMLYAVHVNHKLTCTTVA